MTINIKLPTRWSELDADSLFVVIKLLARYDFETTKSLFLVHLLGKQGYSVKFHPDAGYFFKVGKQTVTLDVDTFVSMKLKLSFIETPDAVRQETINGRKAVHPLLQEDFTFFEYLRVENMYQAFLMTKDNRYLRLASEYLYRSDSGKKMPELTADQNTAILLWIAGIKIRLSNIFPHFFSPCGDNSNGGSYNAMEAMDAQIRALTGGDITKEKEVLDSQCWRALSELNAKAREAEELRKATKK